LGQKALMTQDLVPCMPAAPKAATLRAGCRASADFVAQLIATSAQAPQTRARRRAEPEQATAAYRAQDRRPVPSGGAFSRSL
jgi:hypothetical protein